MMKVFFLNPPFKRYFSRSERSPQVARGGTLYFPVWLALAAAMVEKQGNEISLIDAVADKRSFDYCLTWLREGRPDCLVIEVSTASWHSDREFIENIHRHFPDLMIILAGAHVSAMPHQALIECPVAQAVIRGEYERPLIGLIKAIEEGRDWSNAPGISFRRYGRVVDSADSQFLENLDEVPFASRIYKRFLNHRNYYYAAAKWPGIMLMLGRGCPHHCSWCLFNQTLHGHRYRFRSAENIIQEFEFIIDNFPDIKEIWIEDDTFTANRKHLRDICELILKKKLRFKKHPFAWYCNARPPLDYDTMRLMKLSGCRLFVVGFESGDAAILKAIGKSFTIDDSFEFVNNARRAGILVHGCFSVGGPGENKRSMRLTQAYAKRLMPDSAQFYFIHPYPGTQYYYWAKDNGYLTTEDFSKWVKPDGTHRCVINLPGISSEELENFCENAYKKYYFNFKYLFIKTKQFFRDPSEGLRSIISVSKYLKYLVDKNAPKLFSFNRRR